MRLAAYLRAKGLTISAAARQIGVNIETFRTWVRGKRVPRTAAMRTVMAWSGGLVTANDFCGCDGSESSGLAESTDVGGGDE